MIDRTGWCAAVILALLMSVGALLAFHPLTAWHAFLLGMAIGLVAYHVVWFMEAHW